MSRSDRLGLRSILGHGIAFVVFGCCDLTDEGLNELIVCYCKFRVKLFLTLSVASSDIISKPFRYFLLKCELRPSVRVKWSTTFCAEVCTDVLDYLWRGRTILPFLGGFGTF